MTYPCQATIEGKSREIIGFDAKGNFLELADGQRYTFERLNFNPSGQPPDEPDGDIFGWQLLEAVKLQQWQGDWKWNDEEKLLSKWMKAEFCNAGNRHPDSPEYFKRAVVKARLNALPLAVQAQINGVAWFKHGDEVDSWNIPIFLRSFRLLPPDAKPDVAAQAAANHLKSAAAAATKQIQTVNSELRASTEQLAEVAQPFREMYKDQRLVGAKAEALKAGIPEIVVDAIVRFYHTSKLPTTDGLLKYLNYSGFATKLESAGHGTSRATVGRWLTDFKTFMRRRGLIQDTRSPKINTKDQPADNSAEVENFNSGADQSGLTGCDTRPQELGEAPDTDEP